MSDDSPASGLLEWMNTFPEVAELGITSFVNVRDGIAIATLWNCISSKQIDVSSLGKPTSETDWLTARKNLAAVDAVIGPVLTETNLRKERIDLTSIARKSSVDDLVQMVEPLVIVAIRSPIKTDVLTRIKSLSPNGKRVIKAIIDAFKKAKAEQSEPAKEEKTGDQVKPLEDEIAATKTRIAALNEKLKALQAQSGKIYRKANQGQAQEIADMEQRLEETVNGNRELEAQLENAKKQEGEMEKRLSLLVRKQEVLKEVKERYRREMEAKQDLEARIKQLEQAILKKRRVVNQIEKAKEDLVKQRQENEAGAADVEHEIQEIKDAIKITVDLAEKYGASDDGESAADADECEESVTELAARISQMEIEIAILNDEIASGKSGIPQDTQAVHDELKKVLGKLIRKKNRLEKEKKQRASLREDLQRVQTMIVTQHEEVERELESLAVDINARNIDLTNWLSYSSTFDSWRRSPTFMSELRSRYP